MSPWGKSAAAPVYPPQARCRASRSALLSSTETRHTDCRVCIHYPDGIKQTGRGRNRDRDVAELLMPTLMRMAQRRQLRHTKSRPGSYSHSAGARTKSGPRKVRMPRCSAPLRHFAYFTRRGIDSPNPRRYAAFRSGFKYYASPVCHLRVCEYRSQFVSAFLFCIV
jgi:hypothetical protein